MRICFLRLFAFAYLCTMEFERPITDWLPLTKKEVEKRDDQRSSESDYKQSLYGLTPGQEVKIFIEEGTLNKL